MRETNVISMLPKKQTPSKKSADKKQKVDPEFERLMNAVEGKQKMYPLAMEVNDLLHQIDNLCDKQLFLECKGSIN